MAQKSAVITNIPSVSYACTYIIKYDTRELCALYTEFIFFIWEHILIPGMNVPIFRNGTHCLKETLGLHEEWVCHARASAVMIPPVLLQRDTHTLTWVTTHWGIARHVGNRCKVSILPSGLRTWSTVRDPSYSGGTRETGPSPTRSSESLEPCSDHFSIPRYVLEPTHLTS